MKSFLLSLLAFGFGLLIATDADARHCRHHHRRGGGCNSSYNGGYGYSNYSNRWYNTYSYIGDHSYSYKPAAEPIQP